MQMASMKMDLDWSNLPDDLLKAILDLFVDVSDYIRFASVCKRWLSAAQSHQKQWQKSSSPMLLFGYRGSSITYEIHNKDQLVLNKFHDKLDVPYDKYTTKFRFHKLKFGGYSQGWLIYLHYSSVQILINPFTKVIIHVPPIIRTRDEFEKLYEIWGGFKLRRMKKVVLSDDPSLYPDTYQVLALYSLDFVWLFRSGSSDEYNWVRVEIEHLLPDNMDASLKVINGDAIYYQGKFYITGIRWFITVEAPTDLSSDPCVIFRQLVLQGDKYSGESHQQQLERRRYSEEWHKQYLVESCNGYLLYVEKSYLYRNKRHDGGATCLSFRVYKVNPNHDGSKMMCTRLQNLGGGETLFLGFGPSLSVLKSEFSGYQPGCIYYADRIDNNSEDHMGVYDIVHDIVHCECEGAKRLNFGKRPWIDLAEPPIWIIPRANLNISLVDDSSI